MGETLLDYLRRGNPTIKHIVNPGARRSKSNGRRSTYTIPKWIERWEGFDATTPKRMYPDVLDQVQARDSIDIRAEDLRVRNETGGLSDIIRGWTREVVFRALEETKRYMGRDDIVHMVCGGLAIDPKGPIRPFHPDWAATVLEPSAQTDVSLTRNYLPGDTKYSNCWKSEDVKEGECKKHARRGVFPSWFWPVAQVFTYCYQLQTRYAYIITDEELVLFRVGPKKDSAGPDVETQDLDIEEVEADGKIEFVSVPWKNGRDEEGAELGEPNGLSINTALWWLHLQATHKNSIEWTYGPLEKDILQRSQHLRQDDDGIFFRNDSCRTTRAYTPTERAASDASDILHSFMAGQGSSQFTIPESSATRSRLSLRRRNADRNETTSSFGSAAQHSFVSHSSVTSNKNRVTKSKGKAAKGGRPAKSNSVNKYGSSKDS